MNELTLMALVVAFLIGFGAGMVAMLFVMSLCSAAKHGDTLLRAYSGTNPSFPLAGESKPVEVNSAPPTGISIERRNKNESQEETSKENDCEEIRFQESSQENQKCGLIGRET